MENLDTLFAAGIFLLAFLGFQFGIIYFLLNALIAPVKKDISKLEAGQAKLEANQAELVANQARLEANQAELVARLGRIEALLKKGLAK